MGSKYLWFILFVAGAGLGLGTVISLAFNGPPASPPNGAGAIGVDTSNNISFGTSTTSASTKVLIVGSSTSANDYGLRVIQPGGTNIFVARNDGNVGVGTFTPSYKLSVAGDINSTGVYRVSGAAGASSISCPSGQALGPVTVAGGIVTTGSCTVVTGGPGGGGTVTSVGTGAGLTGGPITTAGTISLVVPVAVSSGGTGLISAPSNGQLLIGNGAGYTLNTLTAGSGISITNGAGSITVAATGAGNDTGVNCPAGQYLTSINITNGNVSGGNCSTPTYQ